MTYELCGATCLLRRAAKAAKLMAPAPRSAKVEGSGTAVNSTRNPVGLPKSGGVDDPMLCVSKSRVCVPAPDTVKLKGAQIPQSPSEVAPVTAVDPSRKIPTP